MYKMSMYKPSWKDLKKFTVVHINKNGDKEEIKNMILDLKIYQDMFSPYLTAKMDIIDSNNYIKQIKVNDLIKFEMETDQNLNTTDGKKKFGLIITDIESKRNHKDKLITYHLTLMDNGFIQDQKVRVIQAFEDKPCISIMQELAGKAGGSIGRVYKKPPMNKLTYIAPNVAPLVGLYTVLRAASPRTDWNFYADYTTKSGSPVYGLISLQDTEKLDPVMVFENRMDNTERKTRAMRSIGIGEDERKNENRVIRQLLADPAPNTFYTLAGYNGSSLSTFNISDKKWKKGNESTNMIFSPIVTQVFDKGESLNESVTSWATQRKHDVLKSTFFTMAFATYGFCKSWELLGQNIYINYLNHDEDDALLKIDEDYREKKILVTAVTHHIDSRHKYTNSFRCTRWKMTTHY